MLSKEAVEQGRRLAAEELLTIMAHDLRNYLTPLKGRLELMEQRAHREGREQDVHDVTAASNTFNLLGQVISDLLDVARLNQGIFTIHPQPINLANRIAEAHYGMLTVDSPEGRGVRVTLALPMEDEDWSEFNHEEYGLSDTIVFRARGKGLSNRPLAAVAVTEEKRKVIWSRTDRNNRRVVVCNRQTSSENRKVSRIPPANRLR